MSQWKEDEKNWEKLGELTNLEMTINCEPASVENLSNGDTVTITASMSEEYTQQGYLLTRNEMTITI